MSSPTGGGARQRKPIEKERTQEEEDDSKNNGKEKAPRSNPACGLPNLYNRFVESLENALNTVSGETCAHPSKKLRSMNLEGVVDFIKREKPRNVVVMTGAGISTSAGIPDFRSPGTGLYDNLQKYNLPDPQAIFEIDFFDKKPEPFFTLAKELFPEDLMPTPCHYFIRLLEKKGMLRRWFTQNIDSLEFLTGIPDEKIVTAHGCHHTSTCRKCKTKYDLEWIMERLRDKECHVPKCPKCGDGVVKPDIVFFGENLPKRFFKCAITDFPKCDLLIIMGTSLVVQPFAGMVHEVGDDVPRILMNLEKAGRVSPVHRALGIQGLCYGRDGNTRDVFWKGTCDDGARKFAELLGWEEDLDALIEKGPVPLKNSVNPNAEEESEDSDGDD